MKLTCLTLTIAIGLAIPSFAADVSLHWSEIAPSVQGVKSTVVLTDGKRIKGTIAQVEPDRLVIDGDRAAVRANVSEIRIRKNHIKGRVILTSIGVGIGGLGAAVPDGTPAFRAASLAIWVGGGYLIGYALDRHEMVIKIVP